MRLSEALRLNRDAVVSIVGAGGKSTALFLLAQELALPVFLSTTTHLSVKQAEKVRRNVIVPVGVARNFFSPFLNANEPVLFTSGQWREDRVGGLGRAEMDTLIACSKSAGIPLIIEADGSRQLPLKAPAPHEPAIPEKSEHVLVVAGMDGIGKEIAEGKIHRPAEFAAVSGARMGERIEPEHVARWAVHEDGGLRNIPSMARRTLLLNQCESDLAKANAGWIAKMALGTYDQALACTLETTTAPIVARFEKTAAIILAAGSASRYGETKQLLLYRGRPLVRLAAETALLAGCAPVVVVCGHQAELVESALSGLPVQYIRNASWQNGQGTSVAAGVSALREARSGAALFMLADQPLDDPLLLRALIEAHAQGRGAIVFPDFEGRRGTPTLFDTLHFRELSVLKGEEGGRQVMHGKAATRLTWLNEVAVKDIDTPGDYQEAENN